MDNHIKQDVKCPHCHSLNNGFFNVLGDKSKPVDGSFNLCAYCAQLSLWVVKDGIYSLRHLTVSEMNDLRKSEHWCSLLDAINKIEQMLKDRQSFAN